MQYIFHPDETYSRKYALIYPQNNCFPMKLINLCILEYFDVIYFLFPSFMYDFLESLSNIFFQKKSCLHNLIEVLRYNLLHILVFIK